MCGIVASHNPNGVNMIVFRRLMMEAMIRGQHATGISYVDGDQVVTIKNPVKASLFELPTIKTTAIIGHCRYSTSDLEYNQPIAEQDFAIAHNGVVTQLPPDDWEEAFGFRCTGRNDTELLLRAFEHDVHPLEAFPRASIAAAFITIDRNGPELNFFRNGQRPLWYSYEDEEEECFVASTRDIFLRAKVEHGPQRCEAGHHYRAVPNVGFMSYQMTAGFEDLQP